MHSTPSSAHAVAVATPCWPAPVSAMMRVLPMRLASRHCPSALLILCAPGVEQVLALEVDGVADRLGEALGVVERRRAPGEVAQQRAQLLEEARVLAGGDPGGLQLGERRHQRLGHVLAPVGAEAVLDGRRAHDTAALGGEATAMNASTLAGSLTPGEASVPDATSTA